MDSVVAGSVQNGMTEFLPTVPRTAIMSVPKEQPHERNSSRRRHFLKCFHANASACLTVEIPSIEPGRARRLALAKQKWPANVSRVPTEDVTPDTVNLETDVEASQRALTSKANEHDNVLRSRLRSKSGPQISRQKI